MWVLYCYFVVCERFLVGWLLLNLVAVVCKLLWQILDVATTNAISLGCLRSQANILPQGVSDVCSDSLCLLSVCIMCVEVKVSSQYQLCY
jgi:hypothetical protein